MLNIEIELFTPNYKFGMTNRRLAYSGKNNINQTTNLQNVQKYIARPILSHYLMTHKIVNNA